LYWQNAGFNQVERVALENAAFVSGMLLITEVKKDEPAMPMGGGMPGMM